MSENKHEPITQVDPTLQGPLSGEYGGRFRRLVAVALLVGTAMTAAACSPGESNSVAPDTATYVADAHQSTYGYETIDTSEITQDIELQAPASSDSTTNADVPSVYVNLQNINPKTHKDTNDFPSDKSAPVLTVELGKNNRLVYTDATPGLSTAESQLLAAVDENAPLLTAAMANGRTHSLRFRITEPSPVPEDPEFPAKDNMFHLPHDYTDGGKPNIYYFLPASQQLDTEEVATMIGHEASHAALDHNDKNLLTAEQRREYTEACAVLRNSALESVGTYNSAEYDLMDLMYRAPKKLKPAYMAVIRALQEGSYGKLPTYPRDASEVSECYIQPPLTAVGVQAEKRGVSKLLYDQYDDTELADKMGKIQDDWNDTIEDFTVLKNIREATWLPQSAINKANGHPEDGVHEVAASSFNRLMQDPEQFGRDIVIIPANERQAIVKIVDLARTMLHQKYPQADDLHKTIDEKYAVFSEQLPRS